MLSIADHHPERPILPKHRRIYEWSTERRLRYVLSAPARKLHARNLAATGRLSYGFIWKYLNGYPDPSNRTYIPPGWNEWVSPAKGSPYTEFNYTLNENGKLVNFGSSPNDYMTDVLTTQVDNYLRAIAGQPQPFFIYLATYNPHEPATPAPRYANLFDNLQAPRLPSFNEADVSGKPPNIRQDPLLTGAQISKN